jgi:hypothetical protein
MGRPAKLETLSIAELKKLIATRRNRFKELQRERTKVARKLAQVDFQLSMIEGSGSNGGRIRPRNESSLVDVMEDVLKSAGQPRRVGDIVDAVHKAGYRSSSANFKGIVNQTLIKDNRFKAVARGVYDLKD